MKINTKYCLLALFFLSNMALQAQEKPSDQLILKDGSTLIGKVLEEAREQLVFQFANGEKVKLSREEIDDRIELKEDYTYFRGAKWLNYKGVYTIFSANFMIGNSFEYYRDDPNTAFEPLALIMGYAFNKYAQIGIGSSLNLMIEEDRAFAPVFIEYRISPWEMSASPFLAIGTGYGFGLTDIEDGVWGISDYRGGFHLRTTLGFTFASTKKTKFQLGLHYQLQESTEDISFCGFVDCGNDKRFITYKRFGLNLGLRF